MTLNKVTKLFPSGGKSLDEEAIQTHIDEQNSNGWWIVGVDNLGGCGWYRFFWAKEVE